MSEGGATSNAEITQILAQLGDTDQTAVARLLPLVYRELRALSEGYLRAERSDHTLQATALVHEAYLRLAGSSDRHWKDRAHFFRAAAKTMRHILMNHARDRRAAKRGGGARPVALTDTAAFDDDSVVELLAIDEALERLADLDAEKARVVELKFYGGCTNQDVAETLGISTPTVERHWRFARAWLQGALSGDG